MEENSNVLFNQDDLVEEPKNNVENGYTEELDFLQPAVAQATQPEVQPVKPEPVYEEAPVETYDDELGDVKPVVSKPVKQEINENPMGKIKLNKEEEKPQEKIDPSTIKLDFKGNRNLKFVIALGILLLLAVFILPIIVTNKVI